MTAGHYTLAQARRELARQECMTEGHDLDIITAGVMTAQEPIRIVCTRGCGHHGWLVTPILCPPGHIAEGRLRSPDTGTGLQEDHLPPGEEESTARHT